MQRDFLHLRVETELARCKLVRAIIDVARFVVGLGLANLRNHASARTSDVVIICDIPFDTRLRVTKQNSAGLSGQKADAVLQDPSTLIIEDLCYPFCRIPMFWNVSKCMYTKKTVFRDIGAFEETNTQIETML